MKKIAMFFAILSVTGLLINCSNAPSVVCDGNNNDPHCQRYFND